MDKKTYLIVAIVIVLVAAGFFWWSGMREDRQPMPETAQSVDTTEAIESELAGIEVGDVEAEFKDVDAALNDL